ncbi:MAG: tRNA (adenosine(37)-N6)-threonylcarbamoyltransferase complex ATPase subunit type 1 TsaE, partial [Acidimicrobiia bacterium]|nr:tRNA (adenosine(37)-N6)-threonylcarbamoyltransferase complex ATPase subunit type 1 TsaE [Acidimicrobiia bacterium]
MIEVLCSSVAETMALGRRLASLLHVGDVILLSGDLGSGKTAFASGIAEGLGVEERVTSPSFVIVRT